MLEIFIYLLLTPYSITCRPSKSCVTAIENNGTYGEKVTKCWGKSCRLITLPHQKLATSSTRALRKCLKAKNIRILSDGKSEVGGESLSILVHVILSSPKEIRATRLRPSFRKYSPNPEMIKGSLYM
jgi:hypothetical protein